MSTNNWSPNNHLTNTVGESKSVTDSQTVRQTVRQGRLLSSYSELKKNVSCSCTPSSPVATHGYSLYLVITRCHLLPVVIICYRPSSHVTTRCHPFSPVVTRYHPLPPVVTRYHLSSPVVNCHHPLEPASHCELLIDTKHDIFCFILAKCWVGSLELVVAGATVNCVGSLTM